MELKLDSLQKNKLSDFLITVSAAWFVGAIISPFLELTQMPFPNIFVGIVNSGLFLWFGLVVVKKG